MAENLSTLSSDGLKGTPTGSGERYTSMITWEAGQQGKNPDLVAAGDTEVLECYNDWPSGLPENVTVTGWTTDATNYITIRAAAGNEHGGVMGAGFWMNKDINTIVLDLNQDYTVVQDIEIQGRQVTTSTGRCINILQASTVERCILHRATRSDSGNNSGPLVIAVSGADIIVRNCLLIGGARAIDQIYTTPLATIENVTCVDYGLTGIRFTGSSSGGSTIKNTVCYSDEGTVTTDYDLNVSLTDLSNNASGDTTATGTGAVTGITTADFVDYGNDYNPTPSGALDGAGADLSGSFTDDIAGNTRVVPWDIGAYGIIAAGGVTFDGPDIVAQTGTENTLFSFDENGEGTVASRFTGATSYALSPDSDPLPAGLTVNPTTGNIEGTPTEAVTRNIIIRGSE